MTIYVSLQSQKMNQGHRRRLEHALAGNRLIVGEELPDDEARRRAVIEADIVFGNPSLAWLEAAPKLRWVQLDSAGVDAYLKLAAAGRVALTNLAGFYDRAVSECALAGMLAYYRQIPALGAAQRERSWIKEEISPMIGQLHGARIVILGAGGIGRRLASVLAPFETEVKIYARHSPEAGLNTVEALDSALAAADILVNTLPHTPQTAGFLDRSRFERLKVGALFVNVGRGSAVDESALLDALDRGQVGGAVLDVTAVEPLPAASPFWAHPRVLLTQHTGGRFPAETDRKLDVFLENFRRLERGERLEGLIDAGRGY